MSNRLKMAERLIDTSVENARQELDAIVQWASSEPEYLWDDIPLAFVIEAYYLVQEDDVFCVEHSPRACKLLGYEFHPASDDR